MAKKQSFASYMMNKTRPNVNSLPAAPDPSTFKFDKGVANLGAPPIAASAPPQPLPAQTEQAAVTLPPAIAQSVPTAAPAPSPTLGAASDYQPAAISRMGASVPKANVGKLKMPASRKRKY